MADNNTTNIDQDQFESKYSPTVTADDFESKYGGTPQGPNPYTGNLADDFFSKDSLGRVMSSFGQGAQQGWGSLGIKSDLDSVFKGVAEHTPLLNSFLSAHKETAKSINENLIRPWAHLADSAVEAPYRAFGALTGGAVEAAGEAGNVLQEKAKALQEDQSTSAISPEKLLLAPLAGGAGEILQATVPTPFDESDPTNQAQAGYIPETPHASFADTTTRGRGLGAIGEGEEGFFNTREVTPQNLTERAQASQDVGEAPTPAPKPSFDINQLAREIDPDTFKEWDRLQAEQDALRSSREYLGSQVQDEGLATYDYKSQQKVQQNISDVQQQLRDVDARLQELVPDTSAARAKVTEALENPSEYGNMYRDYVQNKMLENELKLNELSNNVDVAAGHAQNLLPTPEVIADIKAKEAKETNANPVVPSKPSGSNPVAPEETVQEAAPGGSASSAVKEKKAKTSFTTAKGSTYEENEDGTTTRNKAARADLGHEGQEGPQPKSQRTFYVTPEHADQLGLFQTQGATGKMAVVERADGTAGVKYLDGPNAGKFERRTVATVHTEPASGLIPVETWKEGTRVHFGNAITEVRKEAPETVAEEGNVLREVKGTGETKTRGVSRSLEAEAIEKGLPEEFANKPTYEVVQDKEQISKAQDLVDADPKRGLRIALGHEEAPADLHPEWVYRVVKNRALESGDFETLRRLATESELSREATTMGQRLRAYRGEEDIDPVELIKNVQESREKASVKDINKDITDIQKHLDQAVPNESTWNAFIKSIECK